MEVECLWAKWTKHLEKIDPSPDPEYMDWNPAALSKICGCVSLLGRLEGMILPKVLKSKDTAWRCRDLIAELTRSA
jgi:hypothetical protein